MFYFLLEGTPNSLVEKSLVIKFRLCCKDIVSDGTFGCSYDIMPVVVSVCSVCSRCLCVCARVRVCVVDYLFVR